MSTLLITGASGYLASRLLPLAAAQTDVLAIARRPLAAFGKLQTASVDLTDPAALAQCLDQHRPAAVIHAAAVNPGGPEAQMAPVNHLATRQLAEYAAANGARLLFVSSDTVLDGDNAPYADNAPANPQAGNRYAQSKADGEAALLSICPSALVVRTSLIYGLHQIDRGTEGFFQRLQAGEPLVLFDDVMRQPVWIDALAQALCALALVHTGASGLINVAGREVISRAAFGQRLLNYWATRGYHLPADADIRQTAGKGLAGLPVDLRLQLDRASELGLPLPGVSEVLAAAT